MKPSRRRLEFLASLSKLLGKMLVIALLFEWQRLLLRLRLIKMKHKFKKTLSKYSMPSSARKTLLDMYEEALRGAMPPSLFRALRYIKLSK